MSSAVQYQGSLNPVCAGGGGASRPGHLQQLSALKPPRSWSAGACGLTVGLYLALLLPTKSKVAQSCHRGALYQRLEFCDKQRGDQKGQSFQKAGLTGTSVAVCLAEVPCLLEAQTVGWCVPNTDL